MLKEKKSSVSHSQKKLEKLEKNKAGKKMSYNPTEDFPNNVTFEPSKLQKKYNPNDANIVESAGAIRKFK